MDHTTVRQAIEEVLKNDDRLWNEDKTELNHPLLMDLVEKTDEILIDLPLREEEVNNKSKSDV
jgi:hypothetical protein